MDFTPEQYKAALRAVVDTATALGTIAGSAFGVITAYNAYKAKRDQFQAAARKRKAAKRAKTTRTRGY